MINLVKSPNIVWRDRPIGTRGSQSVSRMYQHFGRSAASVGCENALGERADVIA